MKKSKTPKNTVKTVGIAYKCICVLVSVCVGGIVAYYFVWTCKWC